jgi:hypothetical protein
LGWGDLVTEGLAIVFVEGDHRSMFVEPHVAPDMLRGCLRNPEMLAVLGRHPESPRRPRAVST